MAGTVYIFELHRICIKAAATYARQTGGQVLMTQWIDRCVCLSEHRWSYLTNVGAWSKAQGECIPAQSNHVRVELICNPMGRDSGSSFHVMGACLRYKSTDKQRENSTSQVKGSSVLGLCVLASSTIITTFYFET